MASGLGVRVCVVMGCESDGLTVSSPILQVLSTPAWIRRKITARHFENLLCL